MSHGCLCQDYFARACRLCKRALQKFLARGAGFCRFIRSYELLVSRRVAFLPGVGCCGCAGCDAVALIGVVAVLAGLRVLAVPKLVGSTGYDFAFCNLALVDFVTGVCGCHSQT